MWDQIGLAGWTPDCRRRRTQKFDEGADEGQRRDDHGEPDQADPDQQQQVEEGQHPHHEGNHVGEIRERRCALALVQLPEGDGVHDHTQSEAQPPRRGSERSDGSVNPRAAATAATR